MAGNDSGGLGDRLAVAADDSILPDTFARFDGTEPDSSIADDDYPEYARAVAERARLASEVRP